MPLPDDASTPWPPAPLTDVYDRMAAWSAWWSGDPEELAYVYGGAYASAVAPPSVRNRPSQYRGGITGTLARWWWGAPLPPGERRTKLHVPLAADLASLSADLLFATPPTLTAADKPTQNRLTELIDDGVHARLREGAEIGSALGAYYLRVVWDEEVSDRPWLASAQPDAAIPEWRWDKLAAVTFWQVLAEDGQTVVRHLERHEPGRILHAVYEGTVDQLGRRIPLTEYPQTESLTDALDDADAIETGTPGLTASYVPNARPNRLWRHIPEAANLGRSDYAGLEPLLDSLDETYSSWMRDLRLAKSRLIVPRSYLQSAGRGQGAFFDADQELFVPLDILTQPGESGLTENQFAIRVEEHARTADQLTEQIIRGAGYSVQSLGMEGEGGMITATEVDAREKRSITTRGRKISYTRPPLIDSIESLLAVDRNRFGSKVVPQRVQVEWPDAVAEDLLTLAQTTATLKNARLASDQTLLRMLHRDWSKDEIDEEIVRLRAEAPPPAQRPSGAAVLPREVLAGEVPGGSAPGLNGNGAADAPPFSTR